MPDDPDELVADEASGAKDADESASPGIVPDGDDEAHEGEE